MPNDGRKYELVDGQIRGSPAGGRHGLTIVELTARLLAFVKRKRSGYVFESSTGFRLPKGNVQTLSEKDQLSGEEVLPGFRCRLREIF
jgi:Uma2 family endonuclease